MPAFAGVVIIHPEPEPQKIGESFLRPFPVPVRIHRSDQIILAHSPVECCDKGAEISVPQFFQNLLFHQTRS